MISALSDRLHELLQLVRRRGFDTSTEIGRASERHRRIVLTALGSAAARGTSILTALISVPLTLHYLGNERYGMWMTMSAFTATLSFADLGIGNGVLTAVARSYGQDALDKVRNYVSSAFALLGTIATVVLLVLAVLYRTVSWSELFNVSNVTARAEAAPAIAVFISCFALSLPLGIVQRVQLGMQMGFMASLWQCMASLAGLIGVLIAVWMKAGLPWLVAAFAGAPVMIAAVNSVIFFSRVRPDFMPSVLAISRSHAHELARTGMLFFVLQLAVAVTYTSDNLVIAHSLGAEQVARYSIPDRLFSTASMIVGLAVTPLWPAFGEALARGDRRWARRTLIRATILAGGIGSTICFTFLFTGPMLIRAWVGPTVQVPFLLLFGFAVWRTMETSVGASSMYLNGLRAIRFQVVTAVITGIVAISAKIALLPHLGIMCVPWCTIVAYSFLTAAPMILFLRRHL